MDFLKDVIVIDASSVLAGPSVGSFLAELGARVIKIENKKTGGDVTRHWHTPAEEKNQLSSYYASVNYKKEIIQLDLEEELHTFKSHLKQADILLTNFKTGDYKKFEIENSDLYKLNPRLIHGRIKGFHSEENRVAYDVVLQAETGFMDLNGEQEGLPCKMPVALIDVLAAHQLKEGILIALLQRSQSNRGSFVEVSLEKSALSSLVNQASYYLMTGNTPKRMGSKHPNIAPYGDIYWSADKKAFVLAIGSDTQFLKLISLFKSEKLHSIQYQTNTSRVEHRNELNAELSVLFSDFEMCELKNHFLKLNIPFGEIKNISEVFQSANANEMIYEEEIEDTATKRVKAIAFEIRNMI
jgi:crotonobetainyl-CoA:carnitine CoA-transferase CaiB-like acyl-CoA transferase